MEQFENERALLQAVRTELSEWLYTAREEAYRDLFEGSDAILSEDELRLLDELDSRLTRTQGQGCGALTVTGSSRQGL